MDMTMHEINAAAETITAAADPDANIIFGATINPDLEGEIIITVVATGFDSSYFSTRARQPLKASVNDSANDDVSTYENNKEDETSSINDIDMSLEAPKSDDSSFVDDDNGPTMWSSDNESEKKKEEELDKPSFLRRLTRKNKKDSSLTDGELTKEL